MSEEAVFGTAPLPERLAADQKQRARDRGHFNNYGMREDPTDEPIVDGENAADGGQARRFGAGGDESTYANRAGRLQEAEQSSAGEPAMNLVNEPTSAKKP